MALSSDVRPRPEPDTDPAYVGGMERLVDAVRELASARGLRDVVDIVRHAAREVVGADGATFVLRDEGRCYYVDEDAIAPLWRGLRFPLEACISGWAMLHAQQVVIADIYADDRIPHEAYRPTFVRSLVMTPIRTADPIGSIGTYWARGHEATPAQRRLLQALADSTAVAMENVRVLTELEDRVVQRTTALASAYAGLGAGVDALEAQQRQEWLHACTGITRELLTGAAVDPLRSIAQQARRITAADLAVVLLLSPDEEDLRAVVAVGEGGEAVLGATFPAEGSISGGAIRRGHAVLVPDAREHPTVLRTLPALLPIGPLMVVPLLAEGRARGALALARAADGHPFDAADLDLAASFANHAAIALEFADARVTRQEVALLETREQIAQSLYDEVIHRLFAAGLTVQGVAASVDAPHADKLHRSIWAIDETIAQVRAAIYGLRPTA